MPVITHLRAGAFPARYPGNRGALYQIRKPMTVEVFRQALEIERIIRTAQRKALETARP